MLFDVVSLFPELFVPFVESGVLGKAVDRGTISIDVHNLRAWAGNRWNQIDDEPYGGGAGMVIQAPPVIAAVKDVASRSEDPPRVLMMSPRGSLLTQKLAESLAHESRLMLLCGRYEGFDERARDLTGAEEISIGDYVLGGGEVAAMALIEAVSRLIPGVVGDPESVALDSFADGLLDFPCYTRPPVVEGLEVPPVLRSGDHGAIRDWRLRQSVKTTISNRPDLIKRNWRRMPAEVHDLVNELAPELAAQGNRRLEDDKEGK